jgi:hypothetical protein
MTCTFVETTAGSLFKTGLLLAVFALLGCGGAAPESETSFGVEDRTEQGATLATLSVRIVAPTPGATVRGSVELVAEGTGSVQNIEFFTGSPPGAYIGRATLAGTRGSFLWDTRSRADGPVDVFAKVWDQPAGMPANEAQSILVRLNVANSSTTPVPPSTTSKGSFIERAAVRTYALTGMQVGTGGDPVANGNRFRSVLAAARPGDVITVAPGHYRLAGVVDFTVPDITLKGLGATREDVWFEHTTELRAAFRVKAGGVHFYNFTHRVPATARSALGQSGEGNIWVEGGHSGFRMQDVLAWGSRDAAIFLYGVHHFELNRVESRDSKSDAYHVSNGSSYGAWYDCKSTNSGDDGIGFVGYGAAGATTPHHHTVVRHHVAGQSWGRGFGIIHVHDIQFHGPTLVENSAGAAVILAREAHYGSGAIRAIRFFGELRLRRSNQHTGIGHGAIVINNPDTVAPIEDVLFTGPVVVSNTRTTAPGQVRAFGAGRIQAELRDARFYGTGPSTLLGLGLAPGSTFTTPGWSASSGYSGVEPPFPLN